MAKLTQAGLLIAVALLPSAALAQRDSGIGAPPVMTTPRVSAPMSPSMAPPMASARSQMAQDRWGDVPGGWQAYRRPTYGYRLPRYWAQPTYYIADYDRYRLPRPAPGFGWSRYYDDMVLTDAYGRVYEARGSDDGSSDYRFGDRRARRSNDGIGGALAGAVVGGIAGNLIGGSGNRLAGTLIGGGVGALAGQAIDQAEQRRRDRERYDYDRYDYYQHGPHWVSDYDQSGASYDDGYGSGERVTTTTTTTTTPGNCVPR